MKKKWNVLIFPGGNEVGLEICKSLAPCKEVQVFSASSNVSNHAPYIYKDHFIISDVSDPKWLADLNKIISDNKIDFIFPSHVFVIDSLIKELSNVKCKVVLPEVELVKIFRSKTATINFFKDLIPTPQIFSSAKEVVNYPVYAKPDNWYGQQKSFVAYNEEMLLQEISANEKIKYLIQENLEGAEYSVDCLSNHKGEILFCAGRERLRVRMGTSFNSVIVDDELNKFFFDIAKKITSKTPIIGAWFFQMKADAKGNLKLLEIEPRIAGTMALNRVRGVNFSLLSLYIHSDLDVKVLLNDFDVEIDRSLLNRYRFKLDYEAVYIDLDDVIIYEDGRINTQIMTFLYQCINQKKKIILISKSPVANRDEFLKEKKIYQIFDEIIWLREGQSKADFITNKKSIFIDDSFSQRKEVKDKLGIATFDTSMIEMLLSEKF